MLTQLEPQRESKCYKGKGRAQERPGKKGRATGDKGGGASWMAHRLVAPVSHRSPAGKAQKLFTILPLTASCAWFRNVEPQL